ncbi:MAG: MATE family efflux transporter [Deltaproteobacteria bacterium]|jgi:putative MATE family efflux protein|nr:MATE family efflux transporter [Deltaproteobacteria bacterium]
MATDLTTGSVSRHLRVQATPMALGLIAIISFDFVDLFFVSRLGDAPLAAISFTFPVIWFLGSVAIGYEAGAASCISRAAGEGSRARAARLTTDAALLAGLATLVLCGVGLLTIDPVFSALGATQELLPLITDYMSIWYWTEPASAVMWTCLASMRARGNTALEGKVITAAAILNAILDPIFIFGWFGFPRLEIAGAALASLTATLIMLAFTLIHLSVRLRVFANPIAPLARIAESWRNLLRIGVPAMLTNAIIPIANGIVMAIVATHGVNAVAGFGIAMRIEPIALIPFYALSAVSSPFFGQNVAAGKHDRLVEARRVISRFCLRFGLLLAVALCLAAWPLSALFTQSIEIREVTVDYIWLVSLSYGAYGLVMSVNAAFNGIGRPLPGVLISSMRVLIVFLPLAFLGHWLFGLPGVFGASALCNLGIGAFAYRWLGNQIGASLR